LNAEFPGLNTFACTTAKFLTRFIISIAVLENVPPDAGLQKRDTFSTLNVGLAGTFLTINNTQYLEDVSCLIPMQSMCIKHAAAFQSKFCIFGDIFVYVAK
jgi:hypothetical protein